jgi:zinc protease
VALALAITTAVGLFLAGSASAASTDNVTRQSLANGLDLVVIEDHRAPTVIQMLWYRGGSMDESAGRTGVAHVLEHMMFKGTDRFPEGEFSERVSAAGGRQNAFTSRDYTGYYQQVPVTLLEQIMTMEADRMKNLTFSDASFQSELAVVKEERRSRVDDNPGGKLREQFMAAAYVASPYRWPIIGWMNDLDNMTVQDARHWYESRYGPNNAVLVIAGDVTPSQVLEVAQRTYGTIERIGLPEIKPQQEPEQAGERRVVVKAPARAERLTIGFKAPRLTDIDNASDQFALSMLSAVLSAGDTGRLTRRLVREKRLANRAWASYSLISRGPVMFSLGGTPAAGKTAAELEAALLDQIAQIARDGVDQDELTRIKAQYVAGQVYERDSLFSQVNEVGAMILAGFEPKDSDRILEGVKRVTIADVRRVAGKYFDSDQMTVATLDPQPVDPLAAAKRRAAAPQGARKH